MRAPLLTVAGLGVDVELVSGVTGAVEAAERVDAVLRAPAPRVQALVLICSGAS